MRVHLEPSFPAHLGDRVHFLLNALAEKETHKDSYQLPSAQVSPRPPAPTPALFVTQQAQHVNTHTQGQSECLERRISKQGCVGWSCSEASHSEHNPPLTFAELPATCVLQIIGAQTIAPPLPSCVTLA